jgi:hypothetical protein
MKDSAALALGTLGCLALAACSAPLRERVPLDRGAPTLIAQPFGDLVEQWVDAPGNLYMRRPRPDLASYRALRFEQPAIFYDTQVTPPLVADHSMLVRGLANALRAELSRLMQLPESRRPGEGILRVSCEVVDLEFDRARATNARVTSIVQPGHAATFVLQLTDDATGTPLVRVASRRQMPGGIFTGPWSPELDRAIQLFREFARDARESLAHVVRPHDGAGSGS